MHYKLENPKQEPETTNKNNVFSQSYFAAGERGGGAV